jgi:two-component system, OmpR family, phosphate regulon response regulator PhoB
VLVTRVSYNGHIGSLECARFVYTPELYMPQKTILIVDDEKPIRMMLKTALEMADYHCLEAENAQQAHSMIIDHTPDLVLLDWMMPGTSGIELARRLKRDELTASIPLLLVTAKGEEDNKVQGLEAGADDYVTKPFSPRELLARIKAVLRRVEGPEAEAILQVDELRLDMKSHQVTIQHQPVHMGPTEYRLLEFFLTHQDRVYSRSQLLDHVWGGNVYIDERTVDVHIRRLRKAITVAGHDRLIQTVRGSGYRFSHKFAEASS